MYKVENKEDERLIWLKFLKGDNVYLSLIYLQHANALFDYGCRFSSDRSFVKDCVQEVFCALIRTRKNLGETDNIRLYLLKSLKRLLLKELKKAKKYNLIHGDFDYHFLIDLYENKENYLNDHSDDVKLMVNEALLKLTERQKEAIYLRFNRGLEYEEISFMLDLNYQSSRALIHRAIEKLREILQVPKKKINSILLNIFCQTSGCVL